MQISKDIQIVGTALWLEKPRILIINDLHLGYEEVLKLKGILIPRFQIKEIITQLENIIKQTNPKTIVINGDLKHEFGKVLNDEWKDTLLLLDFLLKKKIKIIIVQGNHDPIIKPIADKRNVKVVKELLINDILITHGDELVETDAKKIIIGHEHPAITIREKSKFEKYKCFLEGKWKNKILITVPSFNPLLEGTDVLKEEVLSPFLENIDNFNVYIVGKGETFNFGKLKDIKFPD